jgi:hypothetical protein
MALPFPASIAEGEEELETHVMLAGRPDCLLPTADYENAADH